ncbi:MAG: NigD-like protein [Bacteroidales bacterium]|nr:NigD-like protein [Bacteroidales bacterium]
MKKNVIFKLFVAFVAMTLAFTACKDDDALPIHTALVTVKPMQNTFVMQLDDTTQLIPDNPSVCHFRDKQVRALVAYQNRHKEANGQRFVTICRIDSIRTKSYEPSLGTKEADIKAYGNDPIDIMRSWVTVAEDGYLTLCLRTVWGQPGVVHYMHLVSGVDESNPYLLELRHNANGDIIGYPHNCLIAFDLRELLKQVPSKEAKFTIRWNSSVGTRTHDFVFNTQINDEVGSTDDLLDYNDYVQ